ncbi:MAG: adenylate/guanylate cyclase domain-containing protein [Candidatus Acidiferrales bacterium]
MAKGIRERITGIFKLWWRHRISFAISVVVTLVGLFIYYRTFLGEQPLPFSDFISRLEYDSLDLRFQLRGKWKPDPRIVIVDIDQHSQEALGRWPFSRHSDAQLVDALRDDGARVAAFDVTFSQPDKAAAPLQQLSAQLEGQRKKGEPVDPKLLKEIARLEAQYDYDKEFATAIERFGKVVLGNYFLYTRADIQGVTTEELNRYANSLAYFPFPQVIALPSAGKDGLVHLIEKYEAQDLLPLGAEANIDVLTSTVAGEKGGTGFFTVVTDPDTVVRHAPLALPYGRDPDKANWDLYASMDVQALRIYLGLTNQQIILNYGDAGVVSIEFGPNLIVYPDPISRLLVNYHGPTRTYPYVSFSDVVQHKFPPGTFKDKIVLVGASATGIGDLRATPFGSLDYPGVEIHANVIDNILNQQFLVRHGPQVIADASAILFFGLPFGILLALVPPRWLVASVAVLAGFMGLIYWAFLHGWWLNLIVPAVTLIANSGFVALYRVLVEEGEKRKVRGAFGQYVSPEVVRRLLEEPESVQPRKTAITVLFSDVRGFTTISEALDAQEMAYLLNGYLTEMTKIIFRNRGTLDKYIGDAVMAFWGAPFAEPGHADRCCETAILMHARLAELHSEWRAKGLPVLEIGVGINTGTASVGNMGSALRYGYTAIGDAVNLASRLEGLNKEYGTRILITESTYITLQSASFQVRELDLIRVKGKLLPVTIYEILTGKLASEDGAELIKLFTKGREAYKMREWKAAKDTFEDVLHRWPEDGPARVFHERCEEYLVKEPPTDWEGVYVMTHK